MNKEKKEKKLNKKNKKDILTKVRIEKWLQRGEINIKDYHLLLDIIRVQ